MTEFQLQLLNDIKGIAFDLDGTLYHGDVAIPGAVDLITYARKKHISLYFLTNNSTKSREDILQRLHHMGIICELHEIYSSGFAAAHYTKENELPDVYISGSQGLKKEFSQLEVPVVSAKDAKTLVIGYDPEFSYEKLTDTLEVALGAEKILACNKERTYPGENSKKMPGCGAMVSAIEWCSNRVVDYIVGKPNTYMLSQIQAQSGMRSRELLVVGDTYESDIVMANSFGSPSVLIGDENHADTLCIRSLRDFSSCLVDILET